MQNMSNQILHDFFDATNVRDFSLLPKLYSQEAIIHTWAGEKQGPEVILHIFEEWLYSFPDLHLEPLCTNVEKDVVVVHWRGTGTFTNSIREIPATGEKVAIHGFTCFRCNNAQVVEHWAYVDYGSLDD